VVTAYHLRPSLKQLSRHTLTPLNRRNRTFRRLALALTTARVLVFAFAPMLELEHAAGSATVAASASGDRSQHGVPAHDSATCPACLVLHTHASDPGAAVNAFFVAETHNQIVAHANVAARSAERRGSRSRAPPIAFA
jgi:hypothetical protein